MSDYFDASGNRISDGLTARATDVNTLRDEVGAAFDLLPSAAALQFNNQSFAVDTSVSDNTYLVSPSSDPASYTDGLPISMRPIRTNTGAATINVNGLGVKSIRNASGLALSAGDIVVGIPVDLRYSTVTGFFHVAPNSAVSATAAAASAAAASTSASTATTQAGIATTQAGTATTQAGIATTQAGNASASASAASGSESTATTQAGIATTQAGIATTQASNASTSAGAAATSASTASTQAGTATTQASTATTQAGIATTQAGIATTQAGNALASANAAAASAAALPNAVTAGADKFLQTNATADGWDYHTAGDARTALGLAIGTDVQAYDADLTTWAGVTPGTGVATALAVNVGTAGAPVVNGGALGTPSSGTVTNLTGTASININGTVGATTPASVAATTLSATGVTTVQAGTALLPAVIPSGDPNTGVWFPAADTVAVSTGGSERMRIDSSGRVGIGNSAPGVQLSVGGVVPIVQLQNATSGTSAADGLQIALAGASNTDAYLWNFESGPLILGTSNIERMRITTTGKHIFGGSTDFTSVGNLGWTPNVIVEDVSGQGQAIIRHTADVYGGSLQLVKARGTVGSPTIVLNGDRLGQIYFCGYDGIDYSNTGASIEAIVNGTPGSNDLPTDLVFSTTPDGSYVSIEHLRIDSVGNVTKNSATGALGYGTGAGGTVTQATSKSTAVTLNKPTGRITSSNELLAAGGVVAFQLNNTLISTDDNVIITVQDGNGYKYNVWAYAVASGNCQVVLKNITAGSLSEALPFNFAIIKGATT